MGRTGRREGNSKQLAVALGNNKSFITFINLSKISFIFSLRFLHFSTHNLGFKFPISPEAQEMTEVFLPLEIKLIVLPALMAANVPLMVLCMMVLIIHGVLWPVCQRANNVNTQRPSLIPMPVTCLLE